MTNKALIILCGLLILSAALPRAHAVICESFTTQAVCERTLTSSGGCKWENGTCVRDPSKILPAGYAAIANIEVPEFLADVPAPEENL